VPPNCALAFVVAHTGSLLANLRKQEKRNSLVSQSLASKSLMSPLLTNHESIGIFL
jgi:hypothetical protein